MTAKTLRLISCGVIAVCAFFIWYIFIPTTLYKYHAPAGPRFKCRLALAEPVECAVLFNDKVDTPDSHRPVKSKTPYSFKPYSGEQPRFSELQFFSPQIHDIGSPLTSDWQLLGTSELTTDEAIEIYIRLGNKPETYDLSFNVGKDTIAYTVGLKEDQGQAAPMKIPYPIFRSRFDDFMYGIIS